MKAKPAAISHEQALICELREDPAFAVAYLEAAIEDTDEPKVTLLALRHIAEARGVAKVAKAAGIERESVYRALSPRGNPRLSTLLAVTRASPPSSPSPAPWDSPSPSNPPDMQTCKGAHHAIPPQTKMARPRRRLRHHHPRQPPGLLRRRPRPLLRRQTLHA